MLLQIGLFLIQTIFHLFTAGFLLRFYAFLFRVNINASGSGLGQFIFALTDWMVLPLRRLLPRIARIDLPSFIPALTAQLLLSIIKSWAFMGGIQPGHVVYLFTIDTLGLIISLFTGLLIIQAVLSWIQTQSSMQYVLNQLTEPILKPIRKVMPNIGGLDLSPLVALLILQVISMVLQSY